MYDVNKPESFHYATELQKQLPDDMKVLYIALTLYICNMMMRVSPYRTTYDKNGDTYKVVQWAILPAAILAILFHRHSSNLFLDVFFISLCKM